MIGGPIRGAARLIHLDCLLLFRFFSLSIFLLVAHLEHREKRALRKLAQESLPFDVGIAWMDHEDQVDDDTDDDDSEK